MMGEKTLLLFSCGVDTLSAGNAEGFGGGGIWSLETDQITGPFDVASAAVVTRAPLYSGKLVQDRPGQWLMMACHDANSDGSFEGIVSDPFPVHWEPDRGGLAATATFTTTTEH
jgi:beta-fructofuranosidase